jgi:hypothetical protein
MAWRGRDAPLADSDTRTYTRWGWLSGEIREADVHGRLDWVARRDGRASRARRHPMRGGRAGADGNGRCRAARVILSPIIAIFWSRSRFSLSQ